MWPIIASSPRADRRSTRPSAAAIEDLYSARLEEHCEILAHHFTRSGNREKAVHYLSLAGKKAARIFAHEQAIAFFQEALGRLDGLRGLRSPEEKGGRDPLRPGGPL